MAKSVLLLTEDYDDRLDALWRAAMEARDDTSAGTMDEGDPYLVLKAEYDELKAEAEAAGLRVSYRGLRDDEWDDLVERFPPRTEGPQAEGDKYLGFNEKEGKRALLLAGLVDPKFDNLSRLDEWIRKNDLPRGTVNGLALRIWQVTNGMGPTDPKSLPPSPTREGATS